MADKRTKAQLLNRLDALESLWRYQCDKNDLLAKQVEDLERKVRRMAGRNKALANALDLATKAASSASYAARELGAALRRESD